MIMRKASRVTICRCRPSIWHMGVRPSMVLWFLRISLRCCKCLAILFPLFVSSPPSTRSIVDQVSEFNEYLAPKPAGAQWDSTNSLFAIWIGINDVGTSVGWVGVSQGYH